MCQIEYISWSSRKKNTEKKCSATNSTQLQTQITLIYYLIIEINPIINVKISNILRVLYWLKGTCDEAMLHASAISSCELIRSRSTNITHVFIIHRTPEEEEEERPQEGCHSIFTTLCCGSKKLYYYSVINQAFLRRGGLSAEMLFLHGTRSKHRSELSTQKYDA